MLIYLFIFICSAFLFYLSEKPELAKYRKCFVFFAIVLPSILAGLRSENVGVDVKIYAIPIYSAASASDNLIQFIQNQLVIGNKDFGFNVLNYFLSRLTNDYHFGLFAYQMITLTFIYLGYKNYEKKFGAPLWLCILLYLLLLYNPSLNIMRQCIAVSILFYGITCMFNKRYVRTILFIFVAILFHSSAILGIPIALMYLFLCRETCPDMKTQIIKSSVLICCGLLFVLLFPTLLKMVVNLGILHSRYLDYLPGGTWSTIGVDSSINILSVMPSLFYLLLILMAFRKMNEYKKESLFLTFSSLIILLLDFSPLYANYLTRAGYYFLPFQAVMLADIADICPAKYKKFYVLMIIAAMLVVWIVTVVILGYYGTIPYEFFWNV